MAARGLQMLLRGTKGNAAPRFNTLFRSISGVPMRTYSESSSLQTMNEENQSLALTDECVKQIHKIAGSGSFLRVLVESGGCSGFQYKFELDNITNEDDRTTTGAPDLGLSKKDRLKVLMKSIRGYPGKVVNARREAVPHCGPAMMNEHPRLCRGCAGKWVFEKDGAKVIIDCDSLRLINGSIIDFQSELIRSAFRVLSNPKADHGCSCGASFTVKL